MLQPASQTFPGWFGHCVGRHSSAIYPLWCSTPSVILRTNGPFIRSAIFPVLLQWCCHIFRVAFSSKNTAGATRGRSRRSGPGMRRQLSQQEASPAPRSPTPKCPEGQLVRYGRQSCSEHLEESCIPLRWILSVIRYRTINTISGSIEGKP